MTAENPAISEKDLVERLFRATSEEGLATTADDYNDSPYIPRRLGVAEVNDVAADILYRTKVIERHELPDVKAILKAKHQAFNAADYAKDSQDRQRRVADPEWQAPSHPTYYRFVGGSLLANLNVVANVAYEYMGSTVLDPSVISVTGFLGRVMADVSGAVELQQSDNIIEMLGLSRTAP
ncbi:MAG TPA: hypothetical protein VGF75_07685 [Candidatus Saccharimonadales bacterium]|jgi:hypothetical protein